jgi:hypothetical protein
LNEQLFPFSDKPEFLTEAKTPDEAEFGMERCVIECRPLLCIVLESIGRMDLDRPPPHRAAQFSIIFDPRGWLSPPV